MYSPQSDPRPRVLLTEARLQRHWSQQEVADRIGTTHVNVSRWERGLTRPNPYYRRKLCMLYGKTEEELGLHPATAAVAEQATTPESPPPVPPPSSPAQPSLPEAPEAPTSIAREVIYDPAIPLAPANKLVGRDEELVLLRTRLCAGGSVALTALNGLPGVGKTALSIALAHDEEVRRYFTDGILWAGLGPNPNITSLLSRWGSMLGISASEMTALRGNEAWARAIHNAIGMRRMLLVIDDAWTIEDALTFKVGGPHCAHLVTTRFSTIAIQVAGDGAHSIKELDEAHSMELLKGLAADVVKREEQRAQDLVKAVGGLPLALTLMGNYLRKQSYSGQTRRIHAALERLSNVAERLHITEPRGPVEAHPSLPGETQQLSLQSVIAVTDQQLSEQTRQALYALSVFPPKPNSFSEDAALVVADCDYETIDTLADAGLLESSGEGRYTLHQTIADYARLQLHNNAPRERLIHYAIQFVEAHKKDYELLDIESSNIFAALDAAYENDKFVYLHKLVNLYTPFMLMRGLYPLAEKHVARAKQSAINLGDRQGIVNTLLYQGQIALKLGDLEQAEVSFKEGLELAREANEPERICAALTDLGSVAWRRGKYALAEEYLKEGLAIARKLNYKERICVILKLLGSVSGNKGDLLLSETYLQEGLSLARQLNDRDQISFMLINLGVTIGEQGKIAEAEEYLKEGLVLARQIGHREQVCIIILNLGGLAIERGNYIQAEEYFQEGLIIARQLGHLEWISILLLNLGEVTIHRQDYYQAETYLDETLLLARQIGRPRIIAKALYACGTIYISQKQIEKAEKVFQEMLTISPEGDQELIALAQYGLARVAYYVNDIQKAVELGKASLASLQKIGNLIFKDVQSWLESMEKEKSRE